MQKVQKVGRENPRLSNKEIAVHHSVCGYNLCAGEISVMRDGIPMVDHGPKTPGKRRDVDLVSTPTTRIAAPLKH